MECGKIFVARWTRSVRRWDEARWEVLRWDGWSTVSVNFCGEVGCKVFLWDGVLL
jgi:hypothetical protein